jgi:hypothetical protein
MGRAVLRSIAIRLPEQLRQPRDVGGDPPRLVLREHLRLQRLGLGFPTVDCPRAREAEAAGRFCHGGSLLPSPRAADGSRQG